MSVLLVKRHLVDKTEKEEFIPLKVRKRLRDKRIRKLYFIDQLSMNEICKQEGHSKTTVFFAINGRSSKN